MSYFNFVLTLDISYSLEFCNKYLILLCQSDTVVQLALSHLFWSILQKAQILVLDIMMPLALQNS